MNEIEHNANQVLGKDAILSKTMLADEKREVRGGLAKPRKQRSVTRRLSQVNLYQQYDATLRDETKGIPIWRRVAIRTSPYDISQQELIKRSTFMLICMLKLCCCVPWATLYFLLGEVQAGLMPLIYSCGVASNFYLLEVSSNGYQTFVIIQLFLILICPIGVHLALGGLMESGGVLLWSFLCPLGGAFFRSSTESIVWFKIYLLSTLPLLLGEFFYYTGETAIAPVYVCGFWVMNIVGVLSIIFCAAVYFAKALESEYDRSENLLHNILPKSIAKRIKMGENPIMDKHGEISLLFTDVVGFTTAAATMSPDIVIEGFLEAFFSATDDAVERRKLTKIKTIGDAYMVAGGLEKGGPEDHAIQLPELSREMFSILADVNQRVGTDFEIRIGMHVGPVIAGVLGTNRFAYDVWGDAVNTASRMESHGKPGYIHLSESAYEKVKLAKGYRFNADGESFVKGKGKMTTYFAKPQSM